MNPIDPHRPLPAIRTRRFGRTEIDMPVFSTGGMRYQTSWNADDPVDEAGQANLEATIDRSLELGLRHIETARGYGTSEAQLGRALARHPRETFILQTKVPPREDTARFERELEESFARLRVDRIDLFGFHGLNRPEHVDWTLRPGGCYEVANRMRREGRIGHLGFSTHGSTRLIREVIESGRFVYVNLHWYYIFQDHRPAIDAARARDMGVFIISPSDKGGRLWDPSRRLVELCAPHAPMAVNDAFCLSHPEIHTLSIGAARPTDFDVHLRALALLDDYEGEVAPIIGRLDARYREAVGAEFAASWREGLPEWDEVPGGVNVRVAIWLRNLVHAFDIAEYGRSRYGMLGKDDHWFPGNPAARFDDDAIRTAAAASPWADRLPDLLREAHGLLRKSPDAVWKRALRRLLRR